jgi:hypothetical protein
MAGEMAVLNAVEGSNIPSRQKSLIRRYYENALGHGGRGLGRVKAHAMGAAHVLRQGGESVVVGAALGALHVELPTGLDVHIGSSPAIPADAVLGVVGLAGAVLLAHEEVSSDLRNAGSAAATVFAFRKTHDFLAARAASKGVTPGSVVAATSSASTAGATAATAAAHGDFGEDPITQLARSLG